MIDGLKTRNLLDLDKTIAKEIFDGTQYAWEVLPKIKEFILELGEKLDSDKYVK